MADRHHDRPAKHVVSSALQYRDDPGAISRLQVRIGGHPQRPGRSQGLDQPSGRRRPDRLCGRETDHPGPVLRSARAQRPAIAHASGVRDGNRGECMIDRLKAGACLLLALAVMAVAPVSAGATLAELAGYAGADRSQRLIEGGRKEGKLTVYSSAPPDDMLVLTAAFEKKYGIKVQVWRASSENIVKRGVSEARAGRHDADIFETNAAEMESLYREKVLHPVKSPHIAELVPQAIPAHGEWIGTRLNVFVLAYNTKLVSKEELPRSYEDLLHPRWKGRLGIEASDLDWFAGVVNGMGEAKGLQLFRDIVA